MIFAVAAKTTSDASKCHPYPPIPNSPRSTLNTVEREISIPYSPRSFAPANACQACAQHGTSPCCAHLHVPQASVGVGTCKN